MTYGVRWVQQAAVRPHRCALNPIIGNSNSQKGFLDFGTDLGGMGSHPGDHVYVSVLMGEVIAEHLGWSAPATVAANKAALERATARIADLQSQLEESQRTVDAVHTLKRAGMVAERKRGPKTKTAA